MAQCPKCGSEHVKFELRSAGTTSNSKYYRTGIKNSWVLPAGKKSYASKRHQKSVAICRDCGYYWEQPKSGSDDWVRKLCIAASLFVLVLGGLTVIGIFTSKKSPLLWLNGAEAFALIFAGLLGIGAYGNSKMAIIETGLEIFVLLCLLFSNLFENVSISSGLLLIVIPIIISTIKIFAFRLKK